MPSPAVLVDQEDVRRGVDGVLRATLEAERERLREVSPEAETLADSLDSMLSGGKRLRAALCYWSWRAHGGDGEAGRDAALAVGAALELFQAAALFHDDVMDASATRRGLPAAHVAHADRHREQGWSGDPGRYGESAAILLGDLALVLAGRALGGATAVLDRPTADLVRELFDDMELVVTTGQFLDVHAQAVAWGVDPAADEERARTVIRAKSARYSVEHPLLLGAAIAGATSGALAAASSYGLPLGEAFQLRDDLLGVFGDPARTGKPAGDDLREGKRTVLVARALATADDDDRALVQAALGRADLAADEVDGVREALVRSGAVAATEALIDELADGALAALEADALVEPGRTMLLALARGLVERDA
ncbi:polyprenyl synthetase family protein [Luteimicrobium sp. DT211]|uniref:polyprenyl synthetase family protein n=1 Tax=Luteimicrobium sp. DT211 TaxID=3393412 RepID=UPI003CF47E3D